MFEPINPLERKLIAATTDPSARAAFIEAMLESPLYCSPVGDVADGAAIGPMVISYQEPGHVLASALFTAPERLRAVVGEDANLLARRGRDLLDELGDHPIHLNPNLAPSVVWSVDDIAQILGQSRRVDVPAGTQTLLTHPAVRPQALIDALARGLGAVISIKGAWLMQAQRTGQPEPSWLLGVEHRGSWTAVDKAITQAIAGVDLGGRNLEAVAITLSPLSRDLRGGIPIVAPKRRGLFSFLRG